MHLVRLTTRMALAVALGAAAFGWAAPAAAQLRVVTYNTGTGQADNPTTGQTARPGISTILSAIGAEVVGGLARPIDVLLLQEQYSMQVTTQSFVNVLNSIYGAGVYARSTINGLTSDSNGEAGRPGLVYNTQTVQLVGEQAFGNVGFGDGDPNPAQQPRSTLRYQLRPVGYGASADFYAYNSHYKSDTGTANNNRRLVEAQAIRTNSDALGNGVHAIYAGDFNIQTSSGTAYQHLLSAGNGQAFDPVNMPGTWHQDGDDNPTAFKILHTQAPATVSQYSGQTLGGMDDRFDFQLITDELRDNEGMSYLTGSYHAFGNNGTHVCCNSPITTGTGAAPAVLTALMQSSDHLPVVADYQLPAKLGVEVAAIPSFVQLGASVPVNITVSNTAPASIVSGADELDYTLGVTGSLSGGAIGTDNALGGGNLHQILLDTSTLGMKSGVLSVTSTSQQVANGLFSLPINFQVIAAFLAADFNADGFVNATDLSAWRGGFGIASAALKSQGDADNDGDVDGADFLTWQQQLGLAPAAIASQSTVPEPASAVLVGIAALGLLHWRRR